MSKIGMWLVRNTEYCAETRNLIEDVIVAVQNHDYLAPATKTELLFEALKGMGFSREQLAAFAKGGLPIEYKIVPVDVKVDRYYRVYVRVPACEESNENIRKDVKAQIVNEQDKCLTELDPDLEIEEDDIDVIRIDWDGEQYE